VSASVKSRTTDAGAVRKALSVAIGGALALAAPASRASFLSGAMLDTAADYIALFVLIAVPIGLIVLFWLVHILPEKIAEKRHHPQKSAINTLCLLSLAFGGLLWPLAWLWAYTRPIGYKTAYGTDKHDDYFREIAEKAEAGDLPPEELALVMQELDAVDAQRKLSLELRGIRARLQVVQAKSEGTMLLGTRTEADGQPKLVPQQGATSVEAVRTASAAAHGTGG
jgi:hypothetical protein